MEFLVHCSKPGLYYYQTEGFSTGEMHTCIVHVRERQRCVSVRNITESDVGINSPHLSQALLSFWFFLTFLCFLISSFNHWGHALLISLYVEIFVLFVSREFRVEVLDQSFDPPIMVVEEGDRIWWHWEKNKVCALLLLDGISHFDLLRISITPSECDQNHLELCMKNIPLKCCDSDCLLL